MTRRRLSIDVGLSICLTLCIFRFSGYVLQDISSSRPASIGLVDDTDVFSALQVSGPLLERRSVVPFPSSEFSDSQPQWMVEFPSTYPDARLRAFCDGSVRILASCRIVSRLSNSDNIFVGVQGAEIDLLMQLKDYPNAIYSQVARPSLSQDDFNAATIAPTSDRSFLGALRPRTEWIQASEPTYEEQEVSSMMQDTPVSVIPQRERSSGGTNVAAVTRTDPEKVTITDADARASQFLTMREELSQMNRDIVAATTLTPSDVSNLTKANLTNAISTKAINGNLTWNATMAVFAEAMTTSHSPSTWEYVLACYGPIGCLLFILLMPIAALLGAAGSAASAAGSAASAAVGGAISAGSSAVGSVAIVATPVFTTGALALLLFWVIVGMFIGWCCGGMRWVSLGFLGGAIVGLVHILLGAEGGYLGLGVYFAFIAFTGYLYITYVSWRFVNTAQEHQPSTTSFSYGLFEGLFPGRNRQEAEEGICCLGVFCTSALWADTACSNKIAGTRDPPRNFWMHLAGFAVFGAFSYVSYGLTSICLLIWLVHNRQRIRRAYNITYGTPVTYAEDACVWIMCSPCAAMQEALQVFFVAPPRKADVGEFVAGLRSAA